MDKKNAKSSIIFFILNIIIKVKQMMSWIVQDIDSRLDRSRIFGGRVLQFWSIPDLGIEAMAGCESLDFSIRARNWLVSNYLLFDWELKFVAGPRSVLEWMVNDGRIDVNVFMEGYCLLLINKIWHICLLVINKIRQICLLVINKLLYLQKNIGKWI